MKKQRNQEELFEHIIERTSEECKDYDNEAFYREVLMQLAPYLFPGEKNAPNARSRLLHAMNEKRGGHYDSTLFTTNNIKSVISNQ